MNYEALLDIGLARLEPVTKRLVSRAQRQAEKDVKEFRGIVQMPFHKIPEMGVVFPGTKLTFFGGKLDNELIFDTSIEWSQKTFSQRVLGPSPRRTCLFAKAEGDIHILKPVEYSSGGEVTLMDFTVVSPVHGVLVGGRIPAEGYVKVEFIPINRFPLDERQKIGKSVAGDVLTAGAMLLGMSTDHPSIRTKIK